MYERLEPSIKILIVEDNPGDVVLIRELIKNSGLSITLTHASTLGEAMMYCSTESFDLILLDLGLPDSMGLDTLKEIHAAETGSALVVMTGLDHEDTALKALREGAQDYLVKNSLTSDGVLRTIKYSIERKKIEELHQKYTRRFSVLSTATGALNEYEDIPSVFRIICTNIRLLLDNAGVIAVDFPDPEYVRLSGIEWISPFKDKIREITGCDLDYPVFKADKKIKNMLSAFENKKLRKMLGGISPILDGVLDEAQCEKLEKLLAIKHVYTVGFIQKKSFYGGFLIFSGNSLNEDDIHIIETISNQTSLNIHRRSIEKDLRLSEDRYKKLNRQLENKVSERTSDLENLNHQLQKELADRIVAEKALKISEARLTELNATKDKFFNIVAHDLKNPFTSLLGSTELLFQNITQLTKEDIQHLAIILNDSAKSGYAILLNLLDWSRSQTGLLVINNEMINLKSLVEENIQDFDLSLSNKQINIESNVPDDLAIYADRNVINTIMRNLISNAIKFSFRSGIVKIQASSNHHHAIISVKDFGTGIPAADLDNLFRIDTKYSFPGTENEQGTGIGLKLCRELLEKQGGNIWVISEEKKGSEFMFSVALCQPPFEDKKQ